MGLGCEWGVNGDGMGVGMREEGFNRALDVKLVGGVGERPVGDIQ